VEWKDRVEKLESDLRISRKQIEKLSADMRDVKAALIEARRTDPDRINKALSEITAEIESIKNDLNEYTEGMNDQVRSLMGKEFRRIAARDDDRSAKILEILTVKINERVRNQLKDVESRLYQNMFTKEDLVKFRREKEELYKIIEARKKELDRIVEKGRHDIQSASDLIRSLEVSKAQMEGFRREIDSRFNMIKNDLDAKTEARIKKFMTDLDARMVTVDRKFADIGSRVDKMNERNDKLVTGFAAFKDNLSDVNQFVKDGINLKFEEFVSHITDSFNDFRSQVDNDIKGDVESAKTATAMLEKTIENDRSEFDAFRNHVVTQLNEIVDDYDRIKAEMNDIIKTLAAQESKGG
jgi:peptidoglycan hydrolase CwlO-like protein